MSLKVNRKNGAAWASVVLVVGLLAAGCSDSGSGTIGGSDDSAPVITAGPTVTSLTETSALITWTTDEDATSAVDFGLSTAYGTTETSPELSVNHTVLVDALEPDTDYHCRAVSADADGNAVASGDVGFTTHKSYSQYMTEGWIAYQAGDIDGARTKFDFAMQRDAGKSDPHVGLGWCDWHYGDLSGAYTEFYGAIAIDSENLDALAARCVVGTDRQLYPQAIEDGLALLAASPAYSFTWVEGFDFYDVRVALARCYYAQGDYASAQEQVDIVNPFNVLDPDAPAYATSLLAVINNLHREFCQEGHSEGSRTPTTAWGQDS